MNGGRDTGWKAAAIVLAVVVLLLLCLLFALGCGLFSWMLAANSGTSAQDFAPLRGDSVRIQPEVPGFTEGATITYVVPGGPAESAGLARGDVITAINGQAVTAGMDLQAIVLRYRPGDVVTVEFRRWRTGQTDTVQVKLGEHPDDASRPFLGIDYTTTPGLGND